MTFLTIRTRSPLLLLLSLQSIQTPLTFPSVRSSQESVSGFLWVLESLIPRYTVYTQTLSNVSGYAVSHRTFVYLPRPRTLTASSGTQNPVSDVKGTESDRHLTEGPVGFPKYLQLSYQQFARPRKIYPSIPVPSLVDVQSFACDLSYYLPGHFRVHYRQILVHGVEGCTTVRCSWGL